jgi:flagellar hook protein FlgE
MPVYNAFQTPTMAMRSQAHALNTIGINVANVNTGGYRRTDTHFETLVSKTLDHESDLGGVKPKDFQRIDQQGFINASSRDLDIAINGDGFFYVSPTLNVTTDIFYTRDGSFEMGIADGQASNVTADDGSSITVNNGYLVDKNGFYVLGVAPDANTGLFSSTGTLQPMRIDEWAFIGQSTTTSTANLGLNLPALNGLVANHAGVVLAANAGTNNGDLETFTIEVVDSNGVRQTAQMNFTKKSVTKTNGSAVGSVWDVSATTSRANSPQIDSVMLQGTVEAGDSYSVTVDGTTVSYNVLGTEGNLAGVRDAMLAAINANATIAAKLTASAGNAAGEISLTALATTTPEFTTTATLSNIDRSQVDTVTIGGTVELNDTYSVTVDGTTVTYTVGAGDVTIDDVRNNFVTAINNNATVAAIVNAAATTSGVLTLTGVTTGTPFTATAASTNVALGNADNTASIANNTITALTGNADNATFIGTKSNYQTTAAQTLSFDSNGQLLSSQGDLTFALNFADGATSTVAIDMTEMKQFGSDFLKFNYDHNGLIKASMSSTSFDNSGHVLGKFEDGTERIIYKLALAQFQNPNGLEMMNGMVFRETPDSGTASQVFADESGRADFTAFAVELSNVDIATEFSRMIMVQNAYNSSATVFKTVDEMVMVARDLKA